MLKKHANIVGGVAAGVGVLEVKGHEKETLHSLLFTSAGRRLFRVNEAARKNLELKSSNFNPVNVPEERYVTECESTLKNDDYIGNIRCLF